MDDERAMARGRPKMQGTAGRPRTRERALGSRSRRQQVDLEESGDRALAGEGRDRRDVGRGPERQSGGQEMGSGHVRCNERRAMMASGVLEQKAGLSATVRVRCAFVARLGGASLRGVVATGTTTHMVGTVAVIVLARGEGRYGRRMDREHDQQSGDQPPNRKRYA